MEQGHTLESLSRAAHAVRAKLALVRVAIDEALEAAELDLQAANGAKHGRSALKRDLAQLRRSSRDWLRDMERWASDLQKKEGDDAKNGTGAKTVVSLNGRTEGRVAAAPGGSRKARNPRARPSGRSSGARA
ncbi:MAG: hypothetical protein HC923_11100 [Myxococcales bacterium]|nr:hypothetical protein [Myxococcales bacterium]